MQRSPSIIILRIHIPASSQVLFDHLDVSGSSSFMNIDTRPTPHQHHDCDCCDQIFHGRGFCNAQTSAFQAVLTVAGKCGQPKTEGIQVVEGVDLQINNNRKYLHSRNPAEA